MTKLCLALLLCSCASAQDLHWYSTKVLPPASKSFTYVPYMWTQASVANTCPSAGAGGSGGTAVAYCITYDGVSWTSITSNSGSFTPAGSTGNVQTNNGTGGLGALVVGTAANNLVQLNGSAKLPAVDGSLLTNLPSGATAIDGVTVTGTPSAGQVPTATSGSAATWQTPSGGSATPAGSSGNVQTNNGSGGLGALIVGTAGLTVGGGTLDVDSSKVTLRPIGQGGADNLCADSSSSTSSAAGCVVASLGLTGTLQTGMLIKYTPAVSCGGASWTLNANGVAYPVYQDGGSTNPATSQCAAGTQMVLEYVGGGSPSYSIIAPGVSSGSSAITSTMDFPAGGINTNATNFYPAWDVSGLGGYGMNALSYNTVGALSYPTGSTLLAAFRSFIWPSNWDNTQPVNVLLKWSSSGTASTFKATVSFSCLEGQTSTSTSPTFGTGSSQTLTEVTTWTTTTVSGVNTNSCAAGKLALIQVARDNTGSGISADSLYVADVAVQWTSH